MKFSESELKEKFEKEVWLYLDKDLSNEQIRFWDEQLTKKVYLKEMLDDILFITEKYTENEKVKIDDELFDKMIERTTEQRIKKIPKN